MYYQNIMSSTTSSTMNVKGSRKVVRAEYYTPIFIFEIPDGLDLEDKTVVEEWWVKYNTLRIKYIGKDEVEVIEPSSNDYDLKRPNECVIEDADAIGYEYEEGEGEERDEEGE